MAQSWRIMAQTHGALHGAVMAQTGSKTRCGGPVGAVRHEWPLGHLMANRTARQGPGRSSFMAQFMAQSWRKLMAQVMAQETFL